MEDTDEDFVPRSRLRRVDPLASNVTRDWDAALQEPINDLLRMADNYRAIGDYTMAEELSTEARKTAYLHSRVDDKHFARTNADEIHREFASDYVKKARIEGANTASTRTERDARIENLYAQLIQNQHLHPYTGPQAHSEDNPVQFRDF